MVSKAVVVDGIAGIPMQFRNSMNFPDDISQWVLPGVARADKAPPAQHVRRRRDFS